jgi:hypothetical protein
MRSFVFGLAAVLWAQTSTAWKWYSYTQDNNPNPNIRPVPTIWSSQKGVVRYLSDTIYVMGTYRGQNGTSMELPDTVGSSINPTIPGAGNYDRTYLAAYDRHTGAILWWMYFYHSSGSTWGQDMAVASDGTVYLLLIGHPDGLNWVFQARGGGMVSGSWNLYDLSGDRASHLLKIQPYQFIPLVARSSVGLSGFGIGSRACDLKHLLLVGDTLLFASGEFHTSILSDLNAIAGLSLPNLLFSITSLTNTNNRGLLVRWNLAADPDLSRVTAAQLRYEDSFSGNADVTGHRLAYDPVSDRIRWLVEMRDPASPLSRTLYYDLSSGGGGSATIGGTFGSPYTLRILSLNTDLSLPPPPNYHNLARSTSIPPTESPYVFSHNNRLVWARRLGEENTSLINGTSSVPINTPGSDYALLVEQVLTSSGNNPNLSRYLQIPGASALSLSGMTVERAGELVYLSGSASGTSWGVGNSLPLGLRSSSRAGFLIGLRRAGPPTYRIIGYRRFFSVGASRDSVEVNGMIYNPTQAQFYLLGTAQDSLLMRPVWPLGRNDTIHPSPGSTIPERLWVGRLDWYRISASGSYTACVPDTITSSVTVRVSGRNVHISEVPPGTNPGWLFDWLPLATPWLSTAATLHIMGPIMGTSEGTYNYTLSPLVAQGQFASGEYCISGTVVPVLAGRRADIIDTLKLTVSGTTIPLVRRTTSTASTFMVTRYAGDPSAPSSISGPYPTYRIGNWRFPFIDELHYHPYYYAPPTYQGQEMLFVIENDIPRQVWGINLRTGMVDSMPVADPSIPHRYFMDPVRGTYWAHEGPSIMVSTKCIVPAPFTDPEKALIHQGITWVSTIGQAYPLRYPQRWLMRIHRAAVLPNGDFVFIADDAPNANYSLWRVSLATDSVYRVTGYIISPSACPEDGVGSSAIIGSIPFTNLAVWGDTVYWIEDAFSSSCLSSSGNRMLIRRAYPVGGITSYKVETLDTILYTGSVSAFLSFSPLPSPGLIFGTYGAGGEVIRYDLSTRQRDTLIRCLLGSLCCEYGLSDWISGISPTAAVLRSSAIVISAGDFLKLAVPIALPGSGDTLATISSIGSVTSVGGSAVTPATAGATLHFGWPSASGPGLDSTYLAISLSGCSGGKPLYYPFYHLPRFGVWLEAPDTVCLGQVFHSYVGRDTEVVDNGCRVSYMLFSPATSAQGKLIPIAWEGEAHRWRAIQPGYDTIRADMAAPKWSYLVSTSILAHPIRIRQGHRLRLTTALEGSYNATTFFHRPHPFLTRYNIAAYHQRILGVSSDSLWRLPYVPGDSLMKAWNIFLTEPSGPCPGPNTWYCDTPWTAMARVELRESPSGPAVDSAYALIDTAGHLYFYGAPLGSIGFPNGSADTLHFCHCDPTTPKYITVRFPNHLPLHTPEVSLPVRGVGEADNIDLRDPTYLEGIPGEHYTFVPGPGGTLRAAAWAGNCADLHNVFIPGGAHVDAGWINAADYDFVITRNGITSGGFSIADLNSDGSVDALDAVIVITNQNALRQSSRP